MTTQWLPLVFGGGGMDGNILIRRSQTNFVVKRQWEKILVMNL